MSRNVSIPTIWFHGDLIKNESSVLHLFLINVDIALNNSQNLLNVSNELS